MKKILCFYEYHYVKEKFLEAFSEKEIAFLKGNIQDYKEKDLKKFQDIEVLTVFISSILDKKNIDKFPNLKLILTRSTGTDHIDIEYTKKKEIEVQNISNYGNIAVAEYGFGLLFELAKKITLANLEVRKSKNFSSRGIHKIETFELAGKKIGIIGTGRIGRSFAEIARAFGMEVLAFDKFKNEEWAKKNKIEYISFDKLLKESDIISLHLPLLKSTKHILSKKEFQKMKDGVIILNTARGALIKTKYFYEVLKNKKIGGAGLDVLENEDCLGREHHNQKCDKKINELNKKIIRMKNVLVTPHNAFNSKEAGERRINWSIEKIEDFFKK